MQLLKIKTALLALTALAVPGWLLSTGLIARALDIPVVVNTVSDAKVMMLVDDSGSMNAVLEHPEFDGNSAAVQNAALTIPSVIFRLDSGAAAPTTAQTLTPALIEMNWNYWNVNAAGTLYAGTTLANAAANMRVVVNASCNNSSGTATNCPTNPTTPRTGSNAFSLYSNSSTVGNNIFQLANLTKVSGVNVTDSVGNEYLYANYRLNSYVRTGRDWHGIWARFDNDGDPVVVNTTVFFTNGQRVVFNGREVFLSAGWYRIEYLRWIFYLSTAAQRAALPGVTRIDAVKNVLRDIIVDNPQVAFGLATLNGSTYSPGSFTTGTYGDHMWNPLGVGAVGGRPRIRAAIGTAQSTLLTTIDGLAAVGGTPLTTSYIETLRYYNGEADNDPYCNNCRYTSPIVAPCDGHFVVMLTDGLPSGESQNSVFGNWITDQDGDNEESAANNRNCSDPVCEQFLDDASFLAYHSDFKTTMGGLQNVKTYAVGLGLDYDLLDSAAQAGGSGQSYYVNSTDEISETLQQIINNLVTTAVGAAGVAVAEVYGENARVYRPLFEALNWSGRLQAFDSSEDDLIERFDAGNILEARNLSTSPRTIYAGYDSDGDNETTTMQAFSTTLTSTWRPQLFRSFIDGTLSTALLATPLAAYTTDAAASRLINYIHGNDYSGLRRRDGDGDGLINKLGDIVYSRPRYVGQRNGRYLTMQGYNNFVAGLKDEPNLVLVGANDGMLHAFDADNGEELWAYIPSGLVRHLELLSRTNYNSQYHKYYVNGQVSVEDVYIRGGWKTIAMFGLGGGGSSYVVLDITDRNTPSLLFEVSDSSVYGESWSEPTVVMWGGSSTSLNPATYNWHMAVSTGENKSTAGTGLVFYDLNGSGIPSPTAVALSTTAAAGTRTTGIAAAQSDRDLNVDRIYAGTEEGHMYRVNVSGSSIASWPVTRVYQGAATQPIVARPSLVLADNPRYDSGASSGATSKQFAIGIYFGTGRYDDIGDVDTIGVTSQKIVGLFDPVVVASDDYSDTISNLTTTNLQNQSTGSFSVTRGTDGIYRVANNRYGFYMNMDTAINITSSNFIRPVGMITYPPLNVRGNLLFSTFLPNQQQCAVGGYGFVQAVNFRTGGGSVVDLYVNAKNPFYNGGIPDVDSNSAYNAADLTAAYNAGTIQPVFDTEVTEIDLDSYTPYKHNHILDKDDINLHATNGGVQPAVSSVGSRGLPGPVAVLFQDSKLVVQTAYAEQTGSEEENEGNDNADTVTICHRTGETITDEEGNVREVKETMSVPESQVNDYLNAGDTLGPCPEDDANREKVTLCHRPPGNPTNEHTIQVSANAVSAHVAHGDTVGACASDPEDDGDGGSGGNGGSENTLLDPDQLPVNLYNQPVNIVSFHEVTE